MYYHPVKVHGSQHTFTFSISWNMTEVNNWLHAVAALWHGKEVLMFSNYEIWWVCCKYETCWYIFFNIAHTQSFHSPVNEKLGKAVKIFVIDTTVHHCWVQACSSSYMVQTTMARCGLHVGTIKLSTKNEDG